MNLGWTWREVVGLIGLAALALALALSCGDVRLRELPEPDAGERVTTGPQPDTSTPVAAAPLGPCDGGVPDTAPCHVDCRTGLVTPAPALPCWGDRSGDDLPYTSRVGLCRPGVLQCVPDVATPVCVGAVYPSPPMCGFDAACTGTVVTALPGDIVFLTESARVEGDDMQPATIARLLRAWNASHTTPKLRFALVTFGYGVVDVVVPFGPAPAVADALDAISENVPENGPGETSIEALCSLAGGAVPWLAADRTLIVVADDAPDGALPCSLVGYRVIALTDQGNVAAWSALATTINLNALTTLDSVLARVGCP